MSTGVQFTCKCGKSKGWIEEGSVTKSCCPFCKRKYEGVYNDERLTVQAIETDIVNDGEWHLPLILPEEQDLAIDTLKKVSVARCARVSYLTHDGTRDLNKDIELYTKLVTSKHWSPLEHVATPAPSKSRHGNFIGWLQHRKQFADEHLIQCTLSTEIKYDHKSNYSKSI